MSQSGVGIVRDVRIRERKERSVRYSKAERLRSNVVVDDDVL